MNATSKPPTQLVVSLIFLYRMCSILGQIEFSAISQKENCVKPATIKGTGRIENFERLPTIMGHFFYWLNNPTTTYFDQ